MSLSNLVRSVTATGRGGKEYHRRTIGPNQMWATDASYFRVVDWGYYYRRYHKALGNVMPSDVLKGRRQEILQRRKEVQTLTIERRRHYNRELRELSRPTSNT